MTGATGRLGGLVVERLLERHPASEVAVSVRDPERATALAERGVDVRRGDFADPASLGTAFAGVGTALVVSSGGLGEEGPRLHGAAITAAREAGVGRLVYTSHQGAGADSAFDPMHTHARTEELLAASGLRWTALRNGFYASTIAMLLQQARDGVLRIPGDGPVSWTTHEDLAEAAALVLLDDEAPDGPTPPLTAGRAVEVASAVGPEVRVELVDPDAHLAAMLGHGVPEDRARMVLGMFAAFAAGEFDVVDPHLAVLLGREPVSQPVSGPVSASAASGPAPR
ncbi:NAD(P)H-binding protein [Nocardioides flavescens]|uniref:NAD(P)H-binding protein n=1 Tax=Nocardioides flavescens TaxID=2691959 RepID=UPI003F6DE61F